MAVVKKHHTDQPLFEIKGDIPTKVVEYLKKEFGRHVEVLKEDEEMVDIFETEWYKKISSTTTPGEFLRIYRENAELTQEELARGSFSRLAPYPSPLSLPWHLISVSPCSPNSPRVAIG